MSCVACLLCGPFTPQPPALPVLDKIFCMRLIPPMRVKGFAILFLPRLYNHSKEYKS